MPHFQVAIDIAAPPDRVYAVMIDVERWHAWTRSITSVKRVDAGPLVVGSRAWVRQPRLPPALWTVTDVVAGRSFTWESVAPGLRVIGHHAVESTESGSRAMLSIELQGLLAGLWWRLTKNITERYVRLEAEGLKARSERRMEDD